MKLITALLLLLMTVTAHADILNVSGQSLPGSVSATAPGHIRLSWQIRNSDHHAAIQSDTLLYALGSCNTPELTLSRSLSGTTDASGTAHLNEVVPVPPALAVRARKTGLHNIVICRTFSDKTTSRTGVIELRVRTSSLGRSELGLQAISLRLSNGERSAVVPRNAPLTVNARVRYQGQGLLEGVWEVAGPISSSEPSQWNPLATIHQRLSAEGHVRLVSPLLPTHTPGTYQIRLRLIRPPVQDDALVLTYQVIPQQTTGDELHPITLLTPAAGGALYANSHFSWRCLPQAHHYLLMLQSDRRQLVIGQAVRPQCTKGIAQTIPSEILWSNIQPDQPYHWWIEAIDDQGHLIGRSAVRSLRIHP